MNQIVWSKQEKVIARRAFDKAYKKECRELALRLKEMSDQAGEPDELWTIHNFLTEKKKEIDQKYDYRYSVLISVFARLMREGRIGISDLEGFDEDKIEKIKHLTGNLP